MTRASAFSLTLAWTIAWSAPAFCQTAGPSGIFPEPRVVATIIDTADRRLGDGREPDDGFYAELGNMITGAGWVSAGPGYRRHVLRDRAVFDASAALSTNLYKVAQVRLECPYHAGGRLTLGTQAMYQDLMRVDYFGAGPDSSKADRLTYRWNNTDVLGYATWRATPWLSVEGRIGRIDRPRHSVPALPHGDAAIAADRRDHPDHPTHGGVYAASATTYWDRPAGAGRVRRYEIEAAQFVPLFTPKWILALHAWEVFSASSTGGTLPFHLIPGIGGENTLRGYDDYRFHDNDTQSLNAESRWALLAHLDLAAFVDAGKVAPRAGDLDFRRLRTSYGAGLRVHGGSATLGRLDVGHSREGWMVFFSMSDPFSRSKPAFGRRAVVPFVP